MQVMSNDLTYWGRVTHICVSKLTIIGSDNGLSPGRRQAIIWTNVGILLIRTLGTNFSEILGEIHSFSFSKMHLKMSSAKWRLFGLGLNELNVPYSADNTNMVGKCATFVTGIRITSNISVVLFTAVLPAFMPGVQWLTLTGTVLQRQHLLRSQLSHHVWINRLLCGAHNIPHWQRLHLRIQNSELLWTDWENHISTYTCFRNVLKLCFLKYLWFTYNWESSPLVHTIHKYCETKFQNYKINLKLVFYLSVLLRNL